MRASNIRRILFLSFCIFAVAFFTSLGVWQLERRIWKLDLIDRVNQRIHMAAAPAPDQESWPIINSKEDTYRRVYIRGYFLNDKETLVQAVTEHGPGFWVMTPLRAHDDTIIIINRGFVPSDRRDPKTRETGQTHEEILVTGLMRMTEPNGAFLRTNNPNIGYWYSRDISAIAEAQKLKAVAPYFIDADDTKNPGGLPIGGMTVVKFHNNHLIYALTWFSLALLILMGLIKSRIRSFT